MTHDSMQRRLIDDYYRTTSASGSAVGPAAVAASVIQLRRRLGSWLDVENKDVLDLGSGTGELCHLAELSGARSVIGVNLSGDEIEVARGVTGATLVQSDITAYLEESEPTSVDRIFALNILEHLDKDALVKTLQASFRALRAGGSLVAMVPNATSPFGSMTRYWDITHQNAFTPSSVRQLSRYVGFGDDVSFRECGPVPHGLKSGGRFLLWQVIRIGIRAYLMIELASGKGGIYTADMQVRLVKQANRTVGG